MTSIRKVGAYLITSVVFTVLCVLGYFQYYLTSPMFQGNSPETVVIDFKSGMNSHELIELINKTQPIQCSLCLEGYIRYKTNKNAVLKAGIYQLSSDITPIRLLEKIQSGKVLIQKLTIKEGQTNRQLFSVLMNMPYIKSQKNRDEALKAYCEVCGGENIEGMFLADTYFYRAGQRETAVLLPAHMALVRALKEIWHNRADNLPYEDPYQLLTAASIIEKETADPREKKLISAVLANRLHKNMRLQMDPTVIYALGERYQYPLSRNDLRLQHPYNTYRHRGLPPGPIANVSLSSLQAAAQPEVSTYLYFVAMPDGHHHFSSTLAEHQNAVQASRRGSTNESS